MAVDRALLDSVAAGAPPVLRLYRWAPATLSFGRNQPARGLYDEDAAAAAGIDFVRRPTGGQAVLHDDELTYAVVAPVAVIGKPRVAYQRINSVLVAALRELGVHATLAGNAASSRDWSDACFRRPERGEVMVAGRKLVGSAQRTESRTILQHGSILLGGSQSPAEALLRDRRRRDPEGGGATDPGAGPAPEPGSTRGWTTLGEEASSRPSLEAVVRAVTRGFEVVAGISLARTTLDLTETIAVRTLYPHFASGEWTWRR